VEVVNANWSCPRDNLVEQPVHRGRESGAFGPHTERVDFGGEEPGNRYPAEFEGEGV